MKINEQGFTERLPSQTSRTTSVSSTSSVESTAGGAKSSSPDNLQLSTLAARLQNSSTSDAGRGARLAQISKAVSSNTFTINPAQISGALVSEAIQSATR